MPNYTGATLQSLVSDHSIHQPAIGGIVLVECNGKQYPNMRRSDGLWYTTNPRRNDGRTWDHLVEKYGLSRITVLSQG